MMDSKQHSVSDRRKSVPKLKDMCATSRMIFGNSSRNLPDPSRRASKILPSLPLDSNALHNSKMDGAYFTSRPTSRSRKPRTGRRDSITKSKAENAQFGSSGREDSDPKQNSTNMSSCPETEIIHLPQISRKYSSAHIRAPVKAVKLYQGSKVFWKCKMNASVCIYHHPEHEMYEVVTVDQSSGRELNRLYVPVDNIYRQVKQSSILRRVKLHRRDLLSQALSRCSAEYILHMLDCCREGTEVTLRKYNGYVGITEEMNTSIPGDLTPVTAAIIQAPLVLRAPSQLLRELKDEQRVVSDLTSKASLYTCHASDSLSKAARTIAVYEYGKVKNPNYFTTARWKWVSVIDKIVDQERTNKNTLTVWRNVNKGRLLIEGNATDVATGPIQINQKDSRRETHNELFLNHNQSIYEDDVLEKCENMEQISDSFIPDDNFRKYKFDPTAKKKKIAVDPLAMTRMFDSFQRSKVRTQERRKKYPNRRTQILMGIDPDKNIEF